VNTLKLPQEHPKAERLLAWHTHMIGLFCQTVLLAPVPQNLVLGYWFLTDHSG